MYGVLLRVHKILCLILYKTITKLTMYKNRHAIKYINLNKYRSITKPGTYKSSTICRVSNSGL